MMLLEFAWCLAFLFLESSAQKSDVSSSSLLHQEGAFYSTNVGNNITLPCFYNEGAVMIYWFKQTLGQKPNTVATFYKHDERGNFHNELKNNPRFELEVGDGKNHLQISDLHTSDSATYYCVAIDAYKFQFGDGATVNIEGSGSNIHAQTVSETIQPGGFVTLNCTVDAGSCDEEHIYYWFKEAKESQPGLIYTRGRNEQCIRTMMTPTHTCDYSMPPKNQNASDDGVASCAVASCGHILFEDWKNMESAGELNAPELVHFLSGALTFTIILSAWMAFLICRMKKTIQSHCAANSDPGSANHCTADSESNRDEESLQYSTLRHQRFNGSRRQRVDTRSQCVYTSVNQAKSTFQHQSAAATIS